MTNLTLIGAAVAIDPADRDVLDFDIIALSDAGFAITLVQDNTRGTTGDFVTFDLEYTNALVRDGTVKSRENDFYSDPVPTQPNATALADGGYAAGFRDQYAQLSTTFYGEDGARVAVAGWQPEFRGSEKYDLNLITLNNGNIAAAWSSNDDDTEFESNVQVRGPDGTQISAVLQIGTTDDRYQVVEATQLTGGGFAVLVRTHNLVHEIHRFDDDGAADGVTGLGSIPTQDGFQMVPTDDGGYWFLYGTSPQFSDFGNLFAQRYDAAGIAAGERVTLDDIDLWADGDSGFEMVTLSGGGYALAYMSAQANPDSEFRPFVDVTLRTFDAFMQPDGASQVLPGGLNRFDDNAEEMNPDLVQLANGDLVVAWMIENTDTRDDDVLAQRLSLPVPPLNETGDDGNDSLVGTPGNDTLNGAQGNDTLVGLAGNDRLLGGTGNDMIYGGSGTDTLNGGDGDDFIFGGAAPDDLRDLIFAGAGDDSVDAGAGNDEVYGQSGDDTLAGGAGVDTLQGQDGNDVITGSSFSDLVFGNAGNDFVNGGFGSDRINGGTGADRFFHVGELGHGSDWVQDYSSAEGDVLLYGGIGATRAQFQVNIANTANAGEDSVAEAFVIYRPTDQILWALVDGAGEDEIILRLGDQEFDLMG